MAERLKDGEMLVCVGRTAMRRADGSFLPSVPLYIKVHESQVDAETGLSQGEAELNNDIAKVLAGKFKQYMDGVRETEGALP